MKYYAIDKAGNKIISYYTNDKNEAVRAFEMLLRGRPGRLDLYKQWVNNDKRVISE